MLKAMGYDTIITIFFFFCVFFFWSDPCNSMRKRPTKKETDKPTSFFCFSVVSISVDLITPCRDHWQHTALVNYRTSPFPSLFIIFLNQLNYYLNLFHNNQLYFTFYILFKAYSSLFYIVLF